MKNLASPESLQLALRCLSECVCVCVSGAASAGLHEVCVHPRTELPARVPSSLLSLDTSYRGYFFKCLASLGLLGACPVPTLSSEVTTQGSPSLMPSQALTASCVLSLCSACGTLHCNCLLNGLPLRLQKVLSHQESIQLQEQQPGKWGGGGHGTTEIVKGPEFFEGARLLAAARTIAAAHHALVKLLFGANNPVTASMDAAPLDTD